MPNDLKNDLDTKDSINNTFISNQLNKTNNIELLKALENGFKLIDLSDDEINIIINSIQNNEIKKSYIKKVENMLNNNKKMSSNKLQLSIKASERNKDIILETLLENNSFFSIVMNENDATFIEDNVRIIGVEAAGRGAKTEETAATMTSGTPGILHGSYSYVLQDNDGQIKEAHSISAGLDYPGVGPEHSYLKDIKRVKYFGITDKEALEAFQTCSKLEGIIPALEPSHALAYLIKAFKNKHKNKVVILNLCGRGDKDLFTAAKAIGFDADE